MIGKVSLKARTGRPTLAEDEEAEIVETCKIFAGWGFGLWKEDVKGVVADFCRTTNRTNPFKQGVPGERRLVGRIYTLTSSTFKKETSGLADVRAQCSRVEIVNHWFIECLKPALNFLKLHDYPERIFNVDEVRFPLSGQPTSVLVK